MEDDQKKRRENLIEDLKPEELKVEKAKLEKEGEEDLVEEVEEEQRENKSENLGNQDKIEEAKERQEGVAEADGLKEDGLNNEPAEDVYDGEEKDELLNEDAIETEEAGFMEGYNRDSEEPKEEKNKSNEAKLEEE